MIGEKNKKQKTKNKNKPQIMEKEYIIKTITSNISWQPYYGIKVLIAYYYYIRQIGKYGRLSYPQNVTINSSRC